MTGALCLTPPAPTTRAAGPATWWTGSNTCSTTQSNTVSRGFQLSGWTTSAPLSCHTQRTVSPFILVGVRISQCKRVHHTVSPSILVGVCISPCKRVHHTVCPFILVGVHISQCKRVHHTVSPFILVGVCISQCK